MKTIPEIHTYIAGVIRLAPSTAEALAMWIRDECQTCYHQGRADELMHGASSNRPMPGAFHMPSHETLRREISEEIERGGSQVGAGVLDKLESLMLRRFSDAFAHGARAEKNRASPSADSSPKITAATIRKAAGLLDHYSRMTGAGIEVTIDGDEADNADLPDLQRIKREIRADLLKRIEFDLDALGIIIPSVEQAS